jgi:hypothetical protein
MTAEHLSPGDDVEAWCTRCRRNLNHRVVAVVRTSIQKVQCLTCGGEHKYYPPKDVGLKSGDINVREGAKTKSATKQSKTSAVNKSAAKAESEWSTFMAEMAPDTVPLSYATSGTYAKGDYMDHPVFGIGRVLSIVGVEKIEVIFKEGRKILIFNRGK